jgi:hypothetical protein
MLKALKKRGIYVKPYRDRKVLLVNSLHAESFLALLFKYSLIEEYLNRVKQLSDQLKAKKLELPKQVVIA